MVVEWPNVNITSSTVVDKDGLRINHGIFLLKLSGNEAMDLLDFKGIIEYPECRSKCTFL